MSKYDTGISEDEFIKIFSKGFNDFTFKLDQFNERVEVFNAIIKKDRLPNYL